MKVFMNKLNLTYHNFEDAEDMEHLNIGDLLQNLDVVDLVVASLKESMSKIFVFFFFCNSRIQKSNSPDLVDIQIVEMELVDTDLVEVQVLKHQL